MEALINMDWKNHKCWISIAGAWCVVRDEARSSGVRSWAEFGFLP